jgi:hypothetical protein
MIPLLLLAAASADLDALDQAVTQCDRAASNPVFAAEAARRSQFLVDVYKQEEAIVTGRAQIASERQALREAGGATSAQDKDLDLQSTSRDDRQKALQDQKNLEAAREDAMDAMRRYYLLHCPAGGKDRS